MAKYSLNQHRVKSQDLNKAPGLSAITAYLLQSFTIIATKFRIYNERFARVLLRKRARRIIS